jgi:hypothetical protein
METRIVQLEGEGDSEIIASNFEEAFGDYSGGDSEYSEARGSRRAKRTARRTARRQERQAKRMERIRNRGERRKARRSLRTEAVAERQARKTMRRREKLARKSLGDEMMPEESGYGDESGYAPEDTGGYAEDTGMGYETPTSESAPSSYEAPSGDYGDAYSEQPSGYESGYDDSISSEVPTYEESMENVPYQDEETSGYGDEGSEYDGSNFSGGYYSFDSKTDNFDEFYTIEGDDFFTADSVSYDDTLYDPAEFSNGAEDYYYNAEGEMKALPKGLSSLTDKIEWNKELIARMKKKLARTRMGKADREALQKKIADRQFALDELIKKLEGYSNFASKKFGKENAQRQVSKAKAGSMLKRFKATGSSKLGSSPYQALDRVMKRKQMRAVTPVEAELNPEISPNRIEIPAEQSNMTGLIGLDDSADYDAPNVRQYDVEFSNASGSGKPKWKVIIPIVAGLIVAGVVVYFIVKKKKS